MTLRKLTTLELTAEVVKLRVENEMLRESLRKMSARQDDTAQIDEFVVRILSAGWQERTQEPPPWDTASSA